MSEPDDHELMLAVQRGETRVLARLFSRHHRALFNFFRKLGHTRQDAEDLLQESFIRMLRYAASYDPEGNFTAWMYRVARNAASDAWSSAARGGETEPEACAGLAAPAGDEPEQAWREQELEQRLQKALLRLPRDRRELVLLSRVRQLGTAELARLCDCSEGAVKVRLHRSLEQLRNELFREPLPAAAAAEPGDMTKQAGNQ